MRIAIVDARRTRSAGDPTTRTTVNFRNARQLAEIFNADHMSDIYDVTRALENGNKYDVFICGFGSQSNDFKQTVKLFDANPDAKIFWLVGEYEQTNYWAIIKAGRRFTVLQNFEGEGKLARRDLIDARHVLNINLLIARPPNDMNDPSIAKKYDCVYYSRWRPGRERYVREYLQKGIMFSSDKKNMKHFAASGCNPKYIGKLNWTPGRETLNRFRYSLYLEDEYTHGVYNHLANRYYESGICNNVVFFDHNCMNTIERSELSHYKNTVMDYVVRSHGDLMERISECNLDWGKHLAVQKTWRTGEMALRDEMIERMKQIVLNGVNA